ncbi:MAG: nucleoside phosphorylase [Erysipelotrichaceae bacterium]|nr:nucleoside phosphorylase [Erysipelotrichaceae bacterium]
MENKIKNGFDSLPQYEKDNKVHHLGINESQIGEGCILTSNLERVEKIKDLFDDAKREAFHREYITYTGTYKGDRISCMSIGNGCMPTEIAVEELRHIGCKRMIKVGSCYAIDPNIKPGSIFVPTGACRCEGATLEYVNIQYPAISDLDAFFALLQSAKELKQEVKTGIIRTHDGLFLESPFAHEGVAERIAPWQKVGVSCVDNECATMFTVASILQLQAGCIYVVTDNLASGEAMDYEKDYQRRIDDIIEIAVAAMSKLIKGVEYEI